MINRRTLLFAVLAALALLHIFKPQPAPPGVAVKR
jgi:hypothetical protein